MAHCCRGVSCRSMQLILEHACLSRLLPYGSTCASRVLRNPPMLIPHPQTTDTHHHDHAHGKSGDCAGHDHDHSGHAHSHDAPTSGGYVPDQYNFTAAPYAGGQYHVCNGRCCMACRVLFAEQLSWTFEVPNDMVRHLYLASLLWISLKHTTLATGYRHQPQAQRLWSPPSLNKGMATRDTVTRMHTASTATRMTTRPRCQLTAVTVGVLQSKTMFMPMLTGTWQIIWWSCHSMMALRQRWRVAAQRSHRRSCYYSQFRNKKRH